ncbi:hypothetical protein J7K50_02195 [bacterium]|nr:hypothetical protein [bacterium]
MPIELIDFESTETTTIRSSQVRLNPDGTPQLTATLKVPLIGVVSDKILEMLSRPVQGDGDGDFRYRGGSRFWIWDGTLKLTEGVIDTEQAFALKLESAQAEVLAFAEGEEHLLYRHIQLAELQPFLDAHVEREDEYRSAYLVIKIKILKPSPAQRLGLGTIGTLINVEFERQGLVETEEEKPDQASIGEMVGKPA